MDNIYSILRSIHSYNRWVVTAVIIAVVVKALIGLVTKSSYGKLDNMLGGMCLGFTHLQILIGLILYFISPLALPFIQENGMGVAMKNETARFYGVEHITMMLLAGALVQIGRTRSKRAVEDNAKHRQSFIFTALAIILIVIGVKW